MKKIQLLTYLLGLIVLASSCGGSEEPKDKMTMLDELKSQKKDIDMQIQALEEELVASGELSQKKNAVLVTAINVKPSKFEHQIEARGTVASRKNILISAETAGRIEKIHIAQGDKVKKGQRLVSTDAAVLRSNIATTKTQLELATTLFKKQSNLWDQNIGSEVQFLEAKNRKETLENQLVTLNAQLRMAEVTAPFDGVVDNVAVKVGEMTAPGMPLVRIVNTDDTYISADISENYLGKFSKGQEVSVYFPSQDQKLTSKISAIGSVLKSENRTFEIEVKLPSTDFEIKPNQIVVLELVDYQNDKALVVPTKLVQRDSKGSYVYELVSDGPDIKANKVYVEPGVSYDLKTEIKTGLKEGQVIAHEGYRELAQDVLVRIKK
ncbi:MAG: efflux RND transporter periplasmic adaptor subunit [Cyclobacteriaceae bacterium]